MVAKRGPQNTQNSKKTKKSKNQKYANTRKVLKMEMRWAENTLQPQKPYGFTRLLITSVKSCVLKLENRIWPFLVCSLTRIRRVKKTIYFPNVFFRRFISIALFLEQFCWNCLFCYFAIFRQLYLEKPGTLATVEFSLGGWSESDESDDDAMSITGTAMDRKT